MSIPKMILFGESGGGNLALAVGLKAKQGGKLEQIDGIYAQHPYILKFVFTHIIPDAIVLRNF